jgi:hypothetical protein
MLTRSDFTGTFNLGVASGTSATPDLVFSRSPDGVVVATISATTGIITAGGFAGPLTGQTITAIAADTTTIGGAVALKAPLASPSFTGTVGIGTTAGPQMLAVVNPASGGQGNIKFGNGSYFGQLYSGAGTMIGNWVSADTNAVNGMLTQSGGINPTAITMDYVNGLIIYSTSAVLGVGRSWLINNSDKRFQVQPTGAINLWSVPSCTLGIKSDANGALSCVTSDGKLKNKVGDLDFTWDKFMQLNPLLYDWKSKTSINDTDTHAGFRADEVYEIFPNATSAAGKDTKGLDSNAMIAYLVKAVQDLQLRVKQLEGVK